MNDQKKAKWILGTSGILLSTLLLSQLQTATDKDSTDAKASTVATNVTDEQQQQMSTREKELVQLDWTNFNVQSVQQQPQQQVQTPVAIQPDRRSQRS